MLEAQRENIILGYKRQSDMQLLSRHVTRNLVNKTVQLPALSGFKFYSEGKKHESDKPKEARNEKEQPPAEIKFPNFPAFPLNETLTRFLKTAAPFLCKNEMTCTITAAKEFEQGIGKKMQTLLEAEAKSKENWLAERWLKAAYMQLRDPVCINISPGLVYPVQDFDCDEAYLQYTSKVIYAALKYKQMIDLNQIPQEKMGNTPLDMSQYQKIFGTCRIPGLKEDSLVYNPYSKHIVVAYKNHYYRVPTYNSSGEIIHPLCLFEQLLVIMENGKKKAGIPIGILGADHRDNWGLAYCELMKDCQNKRSLQEIQEALFVVCLDDEVPMTCDERLNVSGLQLIHGGGSRQNGANRWYDKTIQVIVNRNGINGLCYEHSPAEGQPIAILTDFILKVWNDPRLYEKAPRAQVSPVQLCFNESEALSHYIDRACTTVDANAANLCLDVLHFKEYGREFIKSTKLSPDSYCQMAMQLAFYNLHKTPPPTYESAHLRMYRYGRTETIRSCSIESTKWVKAMACNDTKDEERAKLLREAIKSHRDYTMLALQGKGVDRHLLGLKMMASENHMPLPDFYKSPGYVKSNHFRLSTSQVASKYPAFMCYGPAVTDGYGCCYNPRPNDMIFAISSFNCDKETDSSKFKNAMCHALEDMARLLCDKNEAPPKSKM